MVSYFVIGNPVKWCNGLRTIWKTFNVEFHNKIGTKTSPLYVGPNYPKILFLRNIIDDMHTCHKLSNIPEQNSYARLREPQNRCSENNTCHFAQNLPHRDEVTEFHPNTSLDSVTGGDI